MPQAPDWKRYLDAGMQFTELQRSQARAIASDLAKNGQIARDQVAGAVDDMVAMSRRRRDALTNIVRAEVSRQLSSLGLATQTDLQRLERKLNATVKKTADRAAKQASRQTASKASKASKAGNASKASKKLPAKQAG